jgi:2-polyprenyl-3-methyl-5-hydroxy-6-metoxy-1,4-benzoquinol methylase
MSGETVEKRWGKAPVDPATWNLPALKLQRALAFMPLRPASGFRILDFGCGEGKLLKAMALRFPMIEFHGADIQAPKSVEGYTFHLITEKHYELDEGQFDRIFAMDVLEHVSDPRATVQWLSRLLKPGGKLIAFVPTEGEKLSPYWIFEMVLGRGLYKKTKDHIRGYRRRDVFAWLDGNLKLDAATFSYHFFGSLLDSAFFAACLIPALSRWWWKSNFYYHAQTKAPGLMSRLFKLANMICYWESTLFARVKWFSTGLHITATRPLNQ